MRTAPGDTSKNPRDPQALLREGFKRAMEAQHGIDIDHSAVGREGVVEDSHPGALQAVEEASRVLGEVLERGPAPADDARQGLRTFYFSPHPGEDPYFHALQAAVVEALGLDEKPLAGTGYEEYEDYASQRGVTVDHYVRETYPTLAGPSVVATLRQQFRAEWGGGGQPRVVLPKELLDEQRAIELFWQDGGEVYAPRVNWGTMWG